MVVVVVVGAPLLPLPSRRRCSAQAAICRRFPLARAANTKAAWGPAARSLGRRTTLPTGQLFSPDGTRLAFCSTNMSASTRGRGHTNLALRALSQQRHRRSQRACSRACSTLRACCLPEHVHLGAVEDVYGEGPLGAVGKMGAMSEGGIGAERALVPPAPFDMAEPTSLRSYAGPGSARPTQDLVVRRSAAPRQAAPVAPILGDPAFELCAHLPMELALPQTYRTVTLKPLTPRTPQAPTEHRCDVWVDPSGQNHSIVRRRPALRHGDPKVCVSHPGLRALARIGSADEVVVSFVRVSPSL